MSRASSLPGAAPGDGFQGRRLAFLVLAALCISVFWTLGGSALDGRIGALDLAVQHAVQQTRRPVLEHLLSEVSDLGEGYFLVPLNLFLFSVLRPYRPRLAVLLPAMTLGSVAVEAMGKWLVSRPRPNLVAYGFPSGHVFVAVVFFGGLFYVITLLERRRGWRFFNGAVSATLLLGVAYSRLYLNAHWLTDVLAGFAGGGAYLLTVLAVVDGWARGPDAPGR